jgi:hypothetical protein
MQTAVLIEKLFAGAVVLVCVALLLRQFIGARRRLRLDAVLARLWHRVSDRVLKVWRWPAARRRAQREAEAAIRRARGDRTHWRDGNVIRPKSFGKDRKLH